MPANFLRHKMVSTRQKSWVVQTSTDGGTANRAAPRKGGVTIAAAADLSVQARRKRSLVSLESQQEKFAETRVKRRKDSGCDVGKARLKPVGLRESRVMHRKVLGARVGKSRSKKSTASKEVVENLPDGKVLAKEKTLISIVVKEAVDNLSDAAAVARGIEYLKKRDPNLRLAIEGAGRLPEFTSSESPFLSLARGIVYQQLATNAAAAIHSRLIDLCGGEASVTPAVITQLTESKLRSIGLSARKADYIQDLARKFIEGGLTNASIMLMKDEELITTLTAVKGIGMWSVHMFMIFALHRPDVLPVTDLGIRKGFMELYGLKSLPSLDEMERLSEPWRPYRTIGAWYLWHVKENRVALRKSQKKKQK
ncbi:hypothetical protein KP509_25G007500 [Ceratopteris richardii]|uniref:HhH-GPD domain-containing protein n=1 Tax=Ceratopteris richardii TaxID=49495 RepID=A0A8T2RMN4_CERRI|nr:hypothetical protein KP509_25G007500 [Ceratopteris richardii]